MHKPQKRELNYDPRKKFKETSHVRKRSANEYHTSRWTKESKAFRYKKICFYCKEKGIVTEAQCTDHKVPPEVYGDFWDKSNWVPSCTKCNNEKGLTTDKKLIQEHRRKQRYEKQ